MKIRRILPAVAGGAASFAILYFWRHFHLAHAVVVATAVGALVYSTFGAVERLRDLYRRD